MTAVATTVSAMPGRVIVTTAGETVIHTVELTPGQARAFARALLRATEAARATPPAGSLGALVDRLNHRTDQIT